MFSSANTFEFAQKDRLGSDGLNRLLKETKEEFEKEKSVVASGCLHFPFNNLGHAMAMSYFVVVNNEKRFVVLNVTKDAEEPNLSPHLYDSLGILERITSSFSAEKKAESAGETNREHAEAIKFLQAEKKLGSIFLIPIEQCRELPRVLSLFTEEPLQPLHKQHIILAMLKTKEEELLVFDSQGYIPYLPISIRIPNFVYPDRLLQLKGAVKYEGTTVLAKQVNPHLCGYFLHQYVYSILRRGGTSGLSEIFLGPEDVLSRENYLKNWREITKRITPTPESKVEFDDESGWCLVSSPPKRERKRRASDAFIMVRTPHTEDAKTPKSAPAGSVRTHAVFFKDEKESSASDVREPSLSLSG